jgi:hypothetical protein
MQKNRYASGNLFFYLFFPKFKILPDQYIIFNLNLNLSLNLNLNLFIFSEVHAWFV